jgi:hypothetical protein
MKQLPNGAWISLHDLDTGTTEQEIVDVVLARTGVRLNENQIDITPNVHGASGIVSFNYCQIRDLLNWALSEDQVRGRAFKWRIPQKRKNDRAA